MTVMVEQIQHNDGSLHQLDDLTAIHVLRNPGGWTDEAVRSCRLFAANVLEDRARRANMLKPQRVRDALESRIANGPLNAQSKPETEQGER